MAKISVTVDGVRREDEVEPRLLLVHYLRDRVGKVGTPVGCDTSNCGACTVDLDGRSVKSCSVLAVQADGGDVTTIEGLANGEWHPVQSAAEHGDDAKVMAGGQSLIPLLRLRLTYPEVVVDVGGAAAVKRSNGTVEQALAGAAPDGIGAAAEHAAEGTSPPSDLNGKADYREHLARVLTRRAVAAAAGVS